MDTKVLTLLGVGAMIVGVVGYSLWGKKTKKPSKPIERDLLIRILEELKYEVLSLCLRSAQAFGKADKEMKSNNLPAQMISQYKETQMVKIFEAKQNEALNKYGVSIDEFKIALEKTFVQDKEIQKYNEEIENMLLDTSEGNAPVLKISPELRKALNQQQALNLYKDLHVMLIQFLMAKFYQQAQTNPQFNPHNKQAVIEVIKKHNLFHLKKSFLQTHGPKSESFNYQSFNILVEVYKKESNDFKNKIAVIDEVYADIFEQAGEKLDNEDLKKRFDFEVEKKQVTQQIKPKQNVINSSAEVIEGDYEIEPLKEEEREEKKTDVFEPVVVEENKVEEKEEEGEKIIDIVEIPEQPVQVIEERKKSEVVEVVNEPVTVEEEPKVGTEAVQNVEPKVQQTVEEPKQKQEPQIKQPQIVEPVVESSPVVQQKPVEEQNKPQDPVSQTIQQSVAQTIVSQSTSEPVVEPVSQPTTESLPQQQTSQPTTQQTSQQIATEQPQPQQTPPTQQTSITKQQQVTTEAATEKSQTTEITSPQKQQQQEEKVQQQKGKKKKKNKNKK